MATRGETGETGERAERLTQYSHGAGCACKLGPADLAGVLGPLTAVTHDDLLVGAEWGDDALVWRRADGPALVATLDFFTPIVDDARTWGRIAATNAASDVYAMGGRPLFALNIVAWPRDLLPLSLLDAVLAGGGEAAAGGGWVVAGGHTIDGPEPLYGQAVVGEVDPARMLTNAAAQPGDALVLTKPIGTGVVTTAVKRSDPSAIERGGPLAGAYEAAVEEMTRLNDAAARVAVDAGARGATDVTGFGLLGHLHKMALAGKVSAVVHRDAVPLLPGVEALIAEGNVAGGTLRNLEWVRPWVRLDAIPEDGLITLADAQTSGGLLVALPPSAAADAVTELAGSGHRAAVVGELVEGEAGTITVV